MITLIPTTDQEAFDMTMRHFRTMPLQAMDDGNCVYRMELDAGTVVTCAIGNMIRPEDYDWQIEGIAVDSLIKDHGIDPGQLNVRLLGDLQDLHDTHEYWSGDKFTAWDQAHWIAAQYELDETEVHT